MKGTLVYLADSDAENFCRAFMLRGAMQGKLGVAAASLPRHISLGLPYEVSDFDAYLNFASEFARTLKPAEITLTGMSSGPLGSTGNYSFQFAEGEWIDEMRRQTVRSLREKLHLDVPAEDGVSGSRNITLGFGTASFEAYQNFVSSVKPEEYVGKKLKFNALGVFYYDAPTISASTFFCCKQIPLQR